MPTANVVLRTNFNSTAPPKYTIKARHCTKNRVPPAVSPYQPKSCKVGLASKHQRTYLLDFLVVVTSLDSRELLTSLCWQLIWSPYQAASETKGKFCTLKSFSMRWINLSLIESQNTLGWKEPFKVI